MAGLAVRHTSNYNLIYKPFKFYHYGNICVICESEEDAAAYLANRLATCKRCYSDVEVLDQMGDRLFIRYRGEASKECYDSYWVKPVEMWTAESID